MASTNNTLPATPVFMTASDDKLAFSDVSHACRDLTLAMGKTHQFFIVRWNDKTRHGFSVLARRRVH